MGEFKRLLGIATTKESKPEKEDLNEILYVLKQILSLVIGVVAGVFQLTGFPVILGFVVLSYVIPYTYTFKFLEVEEETVEGVDVFKEGFMLGAMMFMLSWTISYSLAL